MKLYFLSWVPHGGLRLECSYIILLSMHLYTDNYLEILPRDFYSHLLSGSILFFFSSKIGGYNVKLHFKRLCSLKVATINGSDVNRYIF